MTHSKSNIKFQDTGYFSKIMCDYLEQDEFLKGFYGNFPDKEGFKRQIEEKASTFPETHRKVLVKCLQEQTRDLNLSDLTRDHLELLKDSRTFTVTTGHQLNLFTGPLYFLYKIVSAINLSRELKELYPEYSFVPVYWMATEDHDFEEICYFNYKGEKIKWAKEVTGAVGKIDTDGLQEVFDKFSSQLGQGKNADVLRQLFIKSYLEHDTLTEATRYLANALFADQGLVIIDGDDPGLKSLMVPYFKKELIEQSSYREVLRTNEQLGEKYSIQVNPREINLFYLDRGLRERIVFEEGLYKVLDTDLSFSREQICDILERSPEKFSPNVLIRPLYQEVILPNLCYIGGGGELAYWLQLKSFFDDTGVPFPVLLLRNSVLLISNKQEKKLKALDIIPEELFLPQSELIENKVRRISELDIDFSTQKTALQEMFNELKELSDKTDKSFTGAVLAQEKKQLNGLAKLEKRLLRAQKRKYSELVDRISDIQDQLFPKQSLQERQVNFSEIFEIYGDSLIKMLTAELEPLRLEFDIIRTGS